MTRMAANKEEGQKYPLDFFIRGDSRHSQAELQAGFSLIELLLVVAIIAVLSSLVSPALRSVTGGLDMTRGADLVATYAGIARQTAVTRNRNTELRFYFLKDTFGTERCRALQVFLQSDDGSSWDATSRIQNLPDSVCIDSGATLSPLVGSQTKQNGSVSIPGAGTSYQYVAVTFRPDGTAKLVTANDKDNFLTVRPSRLDDPLTTLPDNYATVQIIPATGQVRTFRP